MMIKKHITVIVLIFCYLNVFGQNNICQTYILNDIEIFDTNKIDDYDKYDFSNLWIESDNEIVYGIIGDNHQRIFIKLIKIEKNINKADEYYVYGKSKVKDNICDFVGKITIVKIHEFKSENLGVDNKYKGLGIKAQGLLIAKYEFFEDKNQLHSGTFEGTLKTKWYLDKKEQIRYNNINISSDGYFNNAFIGSWKMYNSNVIKKCNWGDYRVPNCNCDFDIGVGDFNV